MPNLHFYKAVYTENDKISSVYELKESIWQALNNTNTIKLSGDGEEGIMLDILKIATYDKPTIDIDIERADFIFGCLGKEKDITNIQKRNREDYTYTDIEKTESEYVEIFTYFYLFFDNNIIVYLKTSSAPKIEELEKIFQNEDNKKLEIIPIVTKDLIKVLKKKDIIGTTKIKIPVPKDQLLNIAGVNLSQRDFDELRNENEVSLEIEIKAKRDRSIFNNNIIDTLVHSFEKITKAKIKAKNSNEKIQEYDILTDKFIRKVEIKYNSGKYLERRNEIREKILDIYKQNRKDLELYIKD